MSDVRASHARRLRGLLRVGVRSGREGPTRATQSETEAAGWPLRIVMKLKVNDGMNDG